ncbi:MAG TPA: peptidoglycan-binding domain-containing protein [Burkholderiales bacterium]|nr:peptidoglycan-binding domain-containing protein [Burkholderiales bacterium]
MKFHHLLLASAISMAFGSVAIAQQSQSQDQSSQQQHSQNASQQHSMQSMQHDPKMVREIQQKLKQQGYDVREIDGKWGPKTEGALKQWQQAQGMTANGELDQQTMAALGLQGAGSSSTATNSQGSNQSGAATAGNEPSGGTQGSSTQGSSTGGAAAGSPSSQGSNTGSSTKQQ